MSSPEPLPVIHVGLPKAGSTTLQDGLFDGHPEIRCVRHRGKEESAWPFIEAIQDRPPELYRLDEVRRLWEAARAAAPGGEGRRLVLSHEAFVVNENPFAWMAPAALTAERLRGLLGPCRILMVLREQRAWAGSLFAYGHAEFAVRDGRMRGYPEFLRDAFASESSWPLGLGDFRTVAKPWIEAFGRESVKLVLLEDLRDDLPAFAADLCRWLAVDPAAGVEALRGVHANARRKQADILPNTWNRLNGVLPRTWRALRGFVPRPLKDGLRALFRRVGPYAGPVETPCPPELVETFRARYAPDNAWVQEEFGLDLAGKGYLL